jgi:hypothetical protein
MADYVAMNAVNGRIVRAIETINIKKEGQTLQLRTVVLMSRQDAQYAVNFLQRHPRAVVSLSTL